MESVKHLSKLPKSYEIINQAETDKHSAHHLIHEPDFAESVEFPNKSIRFLSKLAAESEVQGDSKRRTGVYESVHEASSVESMLQFDSAVEFRKKSIALGPFVILFAVDKKQQTFFESWKNLKIKPHWCYLSYNQTDKWVMKFARITSKASSSTEIIIPDATSSELIVKHGNLVPKKLQVMLLSSLHIVEEFNSCVLGLDDDGQLHAYTREREEKNIMHSWSYNLNADTPLTTSLPPFYEEFGIEAADFNAITDACFNLKNLNTISKKFKNYRDKQVTSLDKEMLDSLNLIYGYEVSICTESFNKYRENFNTLTEEDAARLSRLYFLGKTAYFHMLVESRKNRNEIDLLIGKIINHNLLCSKEEVTDARKKLWALVEKSPIDLAYLQHELSNSPTTRRQIDPNVWIDFVHEISNENIRLLCYYSNEALRLYDLHRFLLPLAEKYPEKLQDCLDKLTDIEFVHMAQAYADFYRNPPTVRYQYFQNPTVYLTSILAYMTVDRVSQLIEKVRAISEKNSHWKELCNSFEEAMQIVIAKSSTGLTKN